MDTSIMGSFRAFPLINSSRFYESGQRVLVSRKKTKRKPDLEQIEGYDQVWALCPRIPPPGWRILGRFYGKDVFVALRAWDKHWLASHYADAAADIVADWRELFEQQSPHAGNAVGDYLSGVFKDADETD